MRRNRLAVKILKCFLALVLSFLQGTTPLESQTLSPFEFSIPPHFGTVDEMHHGASGRVVYILRDLHAQGEAQRQEISILRWLHRQHGLQWILTEGAEGPINTAFLRSLSSDPAFQEKMMDDLLNKGDLTAAEYLAVMEPHRWSVWGVDQNDLLWRHVDAFRRSQEKSMDAFKGVLRRVQKRATQALQKHSSLRLRHLLKIENAWNAEQLSLAKYFRALYPLATSLGLHTSTYPQLKKLIQLQQLERKLKPFQWAKEFQACLEKQIQLLPPNEAKQWIQLVLNFRLGKTSMDRYLRQLRELIPRKERRRFAPYWSAMRLRMELNANDLHTQLNQLEKEAEKNLVESTRLFDLNELYQRLKLLGRASSLQLAAQEWHQLEKLGLRRIRVDLAHWNHPKLLSKPELSVLNTGLRRAFSFYRLANKRDHALTQNSLRWIERQKTNAVAIIAGGFHSKVLAKNLAAKGYTIIVLTPKVQAPLDQSRYSRLMLGKKTYLDLLLMRSASATLMPPLKLAQNHAALRKALEEKALFLSFLNFLYFQARGPSFLIEIERFQHEIKQSYAQNLEEELKKNRVPQERRTQEIEKALQELDRFFETLSIQNVDKRGATLELAATYGGEPFTVTVMADPLKEIPEDLKDAAETSDLREGVRWFLRPSGVVDSHELEIHPKDLGTFVQEYQDLETQKRPFISFFQSQIKTRVEIFLNLLKEFYPSLPDSDEIIFDLLKRTVFSDLPPTVAEEIITALKGTTWTTRWEDLGKRLSGYSTSAVKIAVREAQLLTQGDGKIQWGSFRKLLLSHSFIHHAMAWELMAPHLLKPAARFLLESKDTNVYRKEEAVNILSSLGGEKDLLLKVLLEEPSAFVAHASVLALSKFGDELVPELEKRLNLDSPKTVERISKLLAQIKTRKSLKLLVQLYFRVPDAQRLQIKEIFLRESIRDQIVEPLWETFSDDLSLLQKDDILTIFEELSTTHVLGPLLYLANWGEEPIASRAKAALAKKSDQDPIFGLTPALSWKTTIRHLHQHTHLEKLGPALASCQKNSPDHSEKFIRQFVLLDEEDDESKFERLLYSEDKEIALDSAQIMDQLEMDPKRSFNNILPGVDLNLLSNLLSLRPLTHRDLVTIRLLIQERGLKAFEEAVQQLSRLSRHFQPEGFDALARSIDLEMLLRIDGYEEMVDLEIVPNLELQIHPGAVHYFVETLGAKVLKRTVVFNSVRQVQISGEEVENLKKKAKIFRQFNNANFEIINYFSQGDWTQPGFNTSKNRIFQMLSQMLDYYQQMHPDDPEIPAMGRKIEELRDKTFDKSELMEIRPTESLEDVAHFHSLVRYLHGKGIENMFDAVKVRLKHSDETSAISTYLVDAQGNILDQVHHPILMLTDKIYDPAKGFPDSLRFFLRNMLHTINPLHSPANQEVLKEIFERNELSDDLRLNFKSPHIQAMIDEHEIIAYFAMGLHTSELYANLTHPNQGGMVQFRWNEGEWKRDIPGEWRERLYLIEKMLRHLGAYTNITDWQLRSRLDKETGARSTADILKVAGTILRTHASFRYLDLPLGLTGLTDDALTDHLEKLSQFLNQMGKDEFYKAVLGMPMEPTIQAIESHELELKNVLNKILRDLGLPPIPEVESKPFGQVAINRYFNKPIEEGLQKGLLYLDSAGHVRRDPSWKEIKQVPEIARRLANEKEHPNLLQTGALLRSLAPILKFTAIGTVNGYPVQRARLDLLGEVITFVIVRNQYGEILAGFGALGPNPYSRIVDGQLTDNLLSHPEKLVQILQNNGFPVSRTSFELSPENQEKALDELKRIETYTLPITGKLLPGTFAPAIGISKGVSVGKARLNRPGLDPETLGSSVWLVPFALPLHAQLIRRSRATVMTGGSPLTHAGMLVREARRPGIIADDGRWIYENEEPTEVHIPYETYDLISEEIAGFQISRRENILGRVAIIQEGDILLVNGDGEIHFFPPHIQNEAREILAWTEKIKFQKDMSLVFGLTRLLRRTPSQDLLQLAIFDLFLNSPQLTAFEKKNFLRVFNLNLSQGQRKAVKAYFSDFLIAKRHEVAHTLHTIKLRLREARQPIEIEYLLSKALDTIDEFQDIQMTLGLSARVYRKTLSEILSLAVERVQHLRDALQKENEFLSLDHFPTDIFLHIKRINSLRKWGLVSDKIYQKVQAWTQRWFKTEDTKLRGKWVHVIGPSGEKALAWMPHRIGVKAAKLAEVADLVPVPPGFAIDVTAYQYFLKENGLADPISRIIRSSRSNSDKSLQIQQLIEEATIPKDLETTLLSQFQELGAKYVAVRSSSTAEDLDKASFAGQMETTLNVQSEEEFLRAIKRSWASLWSQRAIEYRQDFHIPIDVAQAVFVQTMVDSRVSGVMSTINTLTNDWSEMTINAGWGLGTGPIEGNTNADQFILDMKTGRIKSELIKEKMEEYTRVSGERPQAVPIDRIKARSLTDDELKTLHSYGKTLEDYYGVPLDVEFAIDAGGSIHVLQVRPITTVDIRSDVQLTDTQIQRLYQRPLDNFVENLWEEFQSRGEVFSNPNEALEVLQGLFRNQLYSDPQYLGSMYIAVQLLQRWLNHYDWSSSLREALDLIVVEISKMPYEEWTLEKMTEVFPEAFQRLEPLLNPFIVDKLSQDVRASDAESLKPHQSILFTEVTSETFAEDQLIRESSAILESGKSIVLKGDFSWVRDRFYQLAAHLLLQEKEDRIGRLYTTPAVLNQGPKIFRRLYTDELRVQIMDILPWSGQKTHYVRLTTPEDAQAIAALNNAKALELGEPERTPEYFGTLLAHNPLSLAVVTHKNEVVGAIFVSLLQSDGAQTLPRAYHEMTTTHQESEEVNTMVDFWILGRSALIPFTKLLASKWGLEHLIAYSRPGRGGWLLQELAKKIDPGINVQEFLASLSSALSPTDRLRAFLDHVHANEILGIRVDYHTEEGLDQFMTLYLVKHLFLATSDPKGGKTPSDRTPFLSWMIQNQESLAREFDWFNLDQIWDYLHSDRIRLSTSVSEFEFVRKMKPILKRFLDETGRWAVEGVLWKLHFKADASLILPASRSDGTYQDLWTNVMMAYPLQSSGLPALPPARRNVLPFRSQSQLAYDIAA